MSDTEGSDEEMPELECFLCNAVVGEGLHECGDSPDGMIHKMYIEVQNFTE